MLRYAVYLGKYKHDARASEYRRSRNHLETHLLAQRACIIAQHQNARARDPMKGVLIVPLARASGLFREERNDTQNI